MLTEEGTGMEKTEKSNEAAPQTGDAGLALP
jgi:hypothetical protein